MSECKVCHAEYSPELSKLTLSELREVSWDKSLLSDAREEGFCSKWCEKKLADEEYRKNPKEIESLVSAVTVGSVEKAKHLKKSGSVDSRDFKDTPINVMERDKTMVRMIKDGKIDKSLKRDAETIQRNFENERKEKNRQADQKQLHDMKREYGLLPEQLRRGR